MWRTECRLFLLLACAAVAQAWLDDIFTFVDDPAVQPGCTVMFGPGAWCFPSPAPFVTSCCTPGFECRPAASLPPFKYSCQPVAAAALNYSFEAAYGRCDNRVVPGGQCGGGGGDCARVRQCGRTGPWLGACCPNGFTCQPGEAGEFGRVWTCQADVTDQLPPGAAQQALQHPPRPLPPGACTCRLDGNGSRVPMDCPSPWQHAAGHRLVPEPIKVGARGRFVSTTTGDDVVLHGVNVFGWNVGAFNIDGLWAYCDDNYTASTPPCQQDGEIPPHYPEPAIGEAGVRRLGGIRFWGKRTMTNDFATVVYRMKLLGFNAVRIPFKFSDLNEDLPPPSGGGASEFFPCMVDPDHHIALRTLDPLLAAQVAAAGGQQFQAPAYMGPPHPPPNTTGNPACGLPWDAPFAPAYQGAGRGGGGSLQLTQCNWYLPQGPGVPAIQRLLWQVQYLVSQGMYVVLAFYSRADPEPNMGSPALFARNWRNLMRSIRGLPGYSRRLKGRVLVDLVNEPSRWGCQWDKPCAPSGAPPGAPPACAPGVWAYGAAASAVHSVDPDVPILIEGMGQEVQRGKYAECAAGLYPGMVWGEGFITNGPTIRQNNLSDPSGIFAYDNLKRLGPLPVTIVSAAPPNQLVLSPHMYPPSITGRDPERGDPSHQEILRKWDLSWGWKATGRDKTSSGTPLRDVGLLVGEFGVLDRGDSSVSNRDTTAYADEDKAWLSLLGRYLAALSWQNGPASWMWWSWNANAGDTRGIVGPQTTWREVQWTKVRMLVREFGLVPWYCTVVSPDFCATVSW